MRNKLMFLLLISLYLLFCMAPIVLAISLVKFSDQGTDVRTSTTGELLATGNLTIRIFDAAIDGNLIFEQEYIDEIVNGSWNVVIDDFPADFGKTYYKDYIINGDNLNFDGGDRLAFMSPLGEINITSDISLGQKITFLLGGVIDNIINGWLTLTGNLNVRGQGNFSGTVYINNVTDISTFAGNTSWNQSLADTLYASTGSSGGNSSFNQALTDNLYAEIGWNYNQSLAAYILWNAVWSATYNATYEGYRTNVSINWTELTFNTFNTTWDDVVSGENVNASINIYLNNANASYLSTYNATYEKYQTFNNTLNIQQLYNLTANLIVNFSINDFLNKTINLYFVGANSSYNTMYGNGNTSWNETRGFQLYAPNNTLGIQILFNATVPMWINQFFTNANASYLSTYNATYHAFILNVSKNWTEDVYNTYNSLWTGGLSSAIVNSTINQFFTNANASYLSTYNATYEGYRTNVSINWTELTFNTFNTTWDDVVSGENVNASINIYLNNANASYLSTYNATYHGYPSQWNVSINQYFTGANASYSSIANQSIVQYQIGLNSSQNVSLNQILNATIAWYQNLSLNQLLNSTINVYFAGANSSNSANINFSINDFLNKTINLYFNTANASYLSTYNATYHAFILNVSKNWTEDVYNTYNSLWTGGLSSAIVNSTINQFFTNANASYLSTYNATYHGYTSAWNTSINQFFTNANASYLSTYNATYHAFATFNQSSLTFNLTSTDCTAGTLVIGIEANGTVKCATDTTGVGGGGIANYSNYSNYTYYWGADVNSTNSTQITINNGVLTVLESWLRTLFGSFQNATKLDIKNITSIATCSGTDKSQYNGTDFICAADQTGAGGGRILYELRTNATTRNNTHYNQTVFTIPILANTNYTFECNLFVSAVNATTGVQLNVTVPASPYPMSVYFLHPTTATANAYVQCSDNDNLRQCLSASTASLTTGLPVQIRGRVLNGANAGNVEITMKSELLSAAAVVRRGSYCFIETEVAV